MRGDLRGWHPAFRYARISVALGRLCMVIEMDAPGIDAVMTVPDVNISIEICND